MAPTLVVMAAGVGSRYGGAKQMDGVGPGGELLLEYAVFDARRAGFGRAVFIIRRELAVAFDDLARRLSHAIDVTCVIQEAADVPAWFNAPPRTKPWGTAHAVLTARHAVDTAFAVVNADDFYGAASYAMAFDACALAGETGEYAVIGLPVERTLSEHGPVVRAICETADGWLTRIDEVGGIERTAAGVRGTARSGARVLTGREIASMNLWVFAPAIFAQLQGRFDAFLRRDGDDPLAEAPLPEVINELVDAGMARVRVRETPGPWFGLTHGPDRAHVSAALSALVAEGVYPAQLWSPDAPPPRARGSNP